LRNHRMRPFIFLLASVFLIPTFSLAQDLIWQSNQGGVFNENGYSALQTSDGNYLVLGNTYSYGAGGFDIYLLKISLTGDTIWTKTIGGIETDYGYCMETASGGGYIITGSTRSYGNGKKDVYVIRLDSAGTVIWSRTFGGSEDDEGRSIRRTGDHGYIICGTTNSFGAGYSDIYLIKIDSIGSIQWTKTYGGSGGESGYSVRQTLDGGYIAVGATGSFGSGYSSIYAVRINGSGDSLWANAYGGNMADLAYSVEIANDQGYLLIGATSSFGAGFTDACLIKTDPGGTVQWQKTYGGTGDDKAFGLCKSLDGGYLLIGTTDSYGAGKLDIYLVKTTPAGDTVWTETYGGLNSDYGRMVFQDQTNDIIVVGESYSFSAGGTDIYMAKIGSASTPVLEEDSDNLPNGYSLAQNYPNPFNSSTAIEYALPQHSSVRLTVFNILGQLIKEYRFENQRAGVHIFKWDGRDESGFNVPSGIYFYRIEAGNFIESKKMCLIK